jgi:hypothetical protein
MESLKELSFEDSYEINGGEPITLTVLGVASAVIAIGTVAVWIYNNSEDIVKGWNDGLNGTYDGPSCTC